MAGAAGAGADMCHEEPEDRSEDSAKESVPHYCIQLEGIAAAACTDAEEDTAEKDTAGAAEDTGAGVDGEHSPEEEGRRGLVDMDRDEGGGAEGVGSFLLVHSWHVCDSRNPVCPCLRASSLR